LVHNPDQYRGRLLRLRLNVCRVLSYEIPENPTRLRRLYEVWGWTPRTGKRLYVAVTPELPNGFPQGGDVNAEATIHGYFFKLQGYLEATSTPRASPIPAPLFLGRLEWHPSASRTAGGSETLWVIGITSVVGLIFVGRIAATLWRRRMQFRSHPAVTRPVPTTDQWWQTMQAGNSTATDAGRAGTE
jgi:hypothetical protein